MCYKFPANTNLCLHKNILLPKEKTTLIYIPGWLYFFFFAGSVKGLKFLTQVQLGCESGG